MLGPVVQRVAKFSTFGLSFAFGLTACSKQPAAEQAEPCDRQVLTAAIISTAYINPEENGEPRPVQLRLYQLKNDVSFRNSTFEEVWKADEGKLADDLLDRQEFPVYPDDQKKVDFERNPEAQYLVAAALFRTPRGKQWFTTFELPPPPGQEACGASCVDGACDEPADFNPKLYIRVDGTRVMDGSDWSDSFKDESDSLKDETVAAAE